jgi:hypothetical protein
MKGLELSQKYYENLMVPIIKNNFSKYQGRIAAGLVGSGSECYGFDDDISTDHDWGPGFCLWLTDEDYQVIGSELQNVYNELPKTFMGYQRIISAHGNNRTGVFRIGDFYKRYTGKSDASFSLNDWLNIPEHFFAEVTNGKVFEDMYGEFSRIRDTISKYYPEDVRIRKIATNAAIMAQSGQSNYARSMRRSEIVAARLAINEFINSAISIVYLLNREFKIFYKWSFKGIQNMSKLDQLPQLIKKIVMLPVQSEAWVEENDYKWKYMLNLSDEIVALVEEICMLVVKELINQGLTDHDDIFLGNHTENILSRIHNRTLKTMHIMAK